MEPGYFHSRGVIPAVTARDTDGTQGVSAISETGIAINGQSANGLAGKFEGPVHVDLGATNTTALLLTSSGAGWGSGVQLQNTASPTGRTYGIRSEGDGLFKISDEVDHADRLIMDAKGNILVTGDISTTGNISANNLKLFVQAHPTDPTREIVYVALEGGEASTYIRGSGKLDGGEAVITLPEHFGLVTNEAGLTVQLTSRGEWLQLYVASLTTGELIVREAQGKSGRFDYLIQGLRKGYENHEVIRVRK